MRRRPNHFETLETRRLLASDWQNPLRIRDINRDSLVTALDALVAINRLNTQSSATLPIHGAQDPYFDVNGDRLHTPLDLLLVVNALNSGPLLDVRLTNDTGTGTSAQRDGITSDFALQASIQFGAADVVLGKLDGHDTWVDLTSFVDANRLLNMSSQQIEQSFGTSLADGQHNLILSAQGPGNSAELADRVQLSFIVDRTAPTPNFVGDILMTRPDTIEIPLGEPLSADSLATARVNLWDITWGESPVGTPWSELQGPRFPLSVSAVTLSADGSKLIVKPPANTRSIKYLVELDRTVEDLAGNVLAASTPAAPKLYRANYLAPNASAIAFDNTVLTQATLDKTINEFAFSLNAPDRLIWSGNLSFGTMTQVHLLDAAGERIKTWLSNPSTTLPLPETSDVIALPAGHYRLRVLAPPVSNAKFRLLLESQLPILPASRPAGNPGGNPGGNIDSWPMDVYRMQLNAGDRLLIQPDAAGADQSLPLRRAFDSSGTIQEPVETDNGMQELAVTATSNYILLLNRVGFRAYRTPLTIRSLTTDTWTEGSFSVAGERIEFHFAGSTGDLFVLETSDPVSRAQYRQGNGSTLLSSAPLMFVLDGGEGRLNVNSPDVSATALNYRFRLLRLSAATPMTFGEPLPSPPPGEVRYFTFTQTTPSQVLSFAGNVSVRVMRYDLEDAVMRVLDRPGPQLLSPGRYYLMVQASQSTGSLNTWQADLIDASTRRSPLPQAIVTTRFETGYEQYEFTFSAEASQVWRFEQEQPRSVRPRVQLLDAHGALVESFDSRFDWLVPYSGQYSLVISQPSVSEDFVFRFTPALNGLLLPRNQLVSAALPASNRLVYRLTATDTLLFLHVSKVPDAINAWQLLTSDQRMLASGDLNVARDIEVAVEVGQEYWLLLSSSGPGSFELTWRTPHIAQATLPLGQRLAGSLNGYGDRIQIGVSLERGQGVIGTEWQLSPNITARWLDLTMDTAGPVRIWQASRTTMYHLELRNSGQSPASYQLRLDELNVNYSADQLQGFNSTRRGEVFAGSPVEVSAFITQNTAFMLDVLSGFVNDLRLQILDPSNNVVYEGAWLDSPMLIASASGNYRVRVTSSADANAPDTYALQWLTPSLADTIPLDTLSSILLSEYANQLVRVPVPKGQLVYLDAPSNFGTIDLPLAPSDNLAYPLGDYVVLRANEQSGASRMVNMALRSVGAPVPLNVPITLSIENAQTRVLSFDVAAGETFTYRVPNNQSVFLDYVLDENLQIIARGRDGWQQSAAGRVFAAFLVVGLPAGNQEVEVIVASRHTTLATLGLNTVWHSSFARANDAAVLSVDLSIDRAVGLARTSTFMRYTLIAPSGARIELDASVIRLPIRENGVHKLEVISLQDGAQSALKLFDLDSQPLATGDSITGVFAADDPFLILRVEAAPGQRVRVLPGNGNISVQSVIDRLNNRFFNEWVSPSDGQVWVLAYGTNAYALTIERITVDNQTTTIGQWNSGQLMRQGDARVYSFRTTVLGRLIFEIENGDQIFFLTNPFDQTQVNSLRHNSSVLVSGDSTYRISVLNRSISSSQYRWRVSYIELDAPEPLRPVLRSFALGEKFTVDLAEDGRDRWLVDIPIATGQLLSLSALSQHAESIIQYRILANGESDDSAIGWRLITHLPDLLHVETSGRLQLQITGRGRSLMQWDDLNSEAPLQLNQPVSMPLDNNLRSLAWSLPVSINRELDFRTLTAPAGSKWFLLDNQGRQLRALDQGQQLSIVSPKRLTLWLKLVEPVAVSDTVTVRVEEIVFGG